MRVYSELDSSATDLNGTLHLQEAKEKGKKREIDFSTRISHARALLRENRHCASLRFVLPGYEELRTICPS